MEAKNPSTKAVLLVAALTFVLLAGCVGGEDEPATDPDTPDPTGTGSGSVPPNAPRPPSAVGGTGRVLAPLTTLVKERSWSVNGNASESMLVWVPILNGTQGDVLTTHVKATASGSDVTAYLFPPRMVNPSTALQPNRGGIGPQMASRAPYAVVGESSIDWTVDAAHEISHGNESGVVFLFGATAAWSLEVHLSFGTGASFLAIPEERITPGVTSYHAEADIGVAAIVVLQQTLAKPSWTMILTTPQEPLLAYREHELTFPDNGHHNGEGENVNLTGQGNDLGEVLRNMLWVGKAGNYYAELVVAQAENAAALDLIVLPIDLNALPAYFSGAYGGYF